MLGMRLTENQQLQCSSAPAPPQRSVARALAATAHYVDSVDTRQTSGTWTPPTLCCWMEAPLYINLPISTASHCHCIVLLGTDPRMQTRLAGAGVQWAAWWRDGVSGSLGLRLKLIQPSTLPSHCPHLKVGWYCVTQPELH